MPKSVLPFVDSASRREGEKVPVAALKRHAEDWLFDCEFRQHSRRTIENRRLILDKFFWFLDVRGFAELGHRELRQFLFYLSRGHEDPGGRFGNPQLTSPMRPCTVEMYYSRLKAFCNWLVQEEIVAISPLAKIAPPVARADQIQPFSSGQIDALLKATQKSRYALRDKALVLFLLDTALRCTEVAEARVESVDFEAHRVRVLGKGGKHRTVYFGRSTAKALWQYLRARKAKPQEPLFLSERGTVTGESFTRSGLRQLIERLGLEAKLQGVRCSPHTFRHTSALMFLRNGGNVFTLKEILGHTSLTICNRYVALSQADLEQQQRRFSPADNLKVRER